LDQTIGILAHVDAGKTTLSEMMLVHGGVLRSAGRVDHGDTRLDYGRAEQTRGITIYTAQADFSWKNVDFHLIDTPGHTDFAPEMERTLCVLDRAILLVSAVEGVQGHTREIWDCLQRLSIPTVVLINKTDRAGADPSRILAQLRQLSGDCMFPTPEAIAERDEVFLDAYLDGAADDHAFFSACSRLITARLFFPVFCGSALKDEGITELLDFLAWTATAQYDPAAPFGATAYQVRRDKNATRWVFLKVTSGTLRPRMELGGDKVVELRRFSGGKSVNIDLAPAGTICAASGLSGVHAGDPLGCGQSAPVATFVPVMAAGVLFDPRETHIQAVISALRTLEDEEPQLHVHIQHQDITVRVMGKVQLEILADEIAERFGFHVTFGQPMPVYRETIAAPVVGYGHFEPLRHYAEVHLRIAPGPRGSGVTFRSTCTTDQLALNWQRLIETHVLEREHPGVCIGAPLTDVEITLLAGRAHEKHTEGGDFRQAVYRAIRQGLMQAQAVLLEPYYMLVADGGPSLTGHIMSDVQRMSGTCLPAEPGDSSSSVRALVPAAQAWDYATQFAPLTHGTGKLSLQSSGWFPCQHPETVVASAHYDPTTDPENTPDSIFCAHGAGHSVKWYDAPAAMHIKPNSYR
jgi:ribosomal protection tetracycline resistance protein